MFDDLKTMIAIKNVKRPLSFVVVFYILPLRYRFVLLLSKTTKIKYSFCLMAAFLFLIHELLKFHAKKTN